MSAIRLATAATVRAFQTLLHALNTNDSIDREALEDEIGRFRVWSGNLGALQKGHSSLDYRLRDSPLLSSNALKFLGELEDNLNETIAVVSGARLPYEQQLKSERDEDSVDDEDDGFFDDDDDEDEDSGSRTELDMRLAEIVDIIDNLYKLSVRIRTPTIRSRSLKAASYSPKDPETGVDLLGVYADYDQLHVKELLALLRQQYSQDVNVEDYEYLNARLSEAITLRRRQFKYWKRHRDKLGMSTISEEQQGTQQLQPVPRPDALQRNDTLDVVPELPVVVIKDAPSQRTGKTLLSGTEATHYHQSLDEIVDNKSVTSYAVTVKDIHGKGVDLPPPPLCADGEKDFECPYCYIICPARYGRGRAWRTHLLQDLQPYVCTYPDCESGEQLFRSRREWAEHEATHRKAWRCPEHPNAVFQSQHGLENHLRSEHLDSFPESQLPAIVKVGETTTIDVRTRCPICCAPSELNGLGEFHNHIANHLERIATFSLPKNENDEDGSSGAASHGQSHSSESRRFSDLSSSIDASDRSASGKDILDTDVSNSPSTSQMARDDNPGNRALLSAESLHQLPDASQDRVDTLFATDLSSEVENGFAVDISTGNTINTTDPRETKGEGNTPHSSEANDARLKAQEQVVELKDVATLRSMYRAGKLLRHSQKWPPNNSFNQMVSFCRHDITKLKVDAIVNSANKTMQVTEESALSSTTLNNTIHKAAGPGLAKEIVSKGDLLVGKPVLTRGHNLPSRYIIHVASPGYYSGQHDSLTECYRSALDLAVKNEIKTLAFPCLGTGGIGLHPERAAQIALQEVRKYLDEQTEYQFERIIFCAHTVADEKAYVDNISVYFPCSQIDLDISSLAVKVSEVCKQIPDARRQVNHFFVRLDPISAFENPTAFTDPTIGLRSQLYQIQSKLDSIWELLQSSMEFGTMLADIELACVVLASLCSSVTEAIELMKITSKYISQSVGEVWKDYIDDLKRMSRIDPLELLSTCEAFLGWLSNSIAKNDTEPEEMPDMRRTLETYAMRSSKKGIEEDQSRLDLFTEALYVRQFRQEATDSPHIGNTVTSDQIPTLTHLYKLGELQQKHTTALPSPNFNDLVCLIREDITKLQVDVLVNSTNPSFTGSGMLNRSVFAKGGPELQKAVAAFGACRTGDVWGTGGYNLPAKYILHVVPPPHFTNNARAVIAQIYQQILQKAAKLEARSVAIPCLGTGALNYPRRTAASLAMEEVRKFLEASDHTNPLPKIVFVVYASSDESVYKRLLPVYFPPLDPDIDNLPLSIEVDDSNSSERLHHKLPEQINEDLRSVHFSQQDPETSRTINSIEKGYLAAFESHAEACETCVEPERLYLQGRDLCELGYTLAQSVLRLMNMHADQSICSKPDANGNMVALMLPEGMYPISIKLLEVVEKSSRQGDRSRPFVTPFRSYNAIIQDQAPTGTQETSKDPSSSKELYKMARARVFSGNKNLGWTEVGPNECQVLVFSTHGEVQVPDSDPGTNPLLSFNFYPAMHVERHKTTPEVVLDDKILFRCPSDAECNSLLRMLRRAIEHLPNRLESQVDPHSRRSSLAVGAGAAKASRQDLGKGEVVLAGHAEEMDAPRSPSPPADIPAFSSEESPGDEESSKPVPSKPPDDSASEFPTSSHEYSHWRKQLQDIRDQISSNKQASGGLGDLQYKIDRLNKATTSLSLQSEEGGKKESKEPYKSHQRSLADLLLEYLVEDLKNRQGSYIGATFEEIVSGLRMAPGEAEVALDELASQGKIHNTVNNKTWVVSDPLEGLSVIVKDDTLTEHTSETTQGAQLSALAKSLLTHLEEQPDGHLQDAYHVYDLSAKTRKTIDQVLKALMELEAAGQAHIKGGNELYWAAGPIQGKQDESSKMTPKHLATQGPSTEYLLSTLASRVYGFLKLNDSQGYSTQELATEFKVSRDDARAAISELASYGLVTDPNGWDTWAVTTPGQAHASANPPKAQADDTPSPFLEVSPPSPTSASASRSRLIPPSKQTLSAPVGDIDINKYITYNTGEKKTWISKELVDRRVLDSLREDFEDQVSQFFVGRIVHRSEILQWAEMSRKLRLEKPVVTGKGKERARGSEKDEDQRRLEMMLEGGLREEELRHFQGDEKDDERFH